MPKFQTAGIAWDTIIGRFQKLHNIKDTTGLTGMDDQNNNY